jgi:small-conductance mechanosensitive channel
MRADEREINSLAARFRQISAAVVPLREQEIMMSTARANLSEMKNAADRLRTDTTRYLLLRSATIVAGILLLGAFSAILRRATIRYIRDARRRRQFTVLRRVVVISVATVVIALGFISDFGSLATYAGFLTAGIAVALQNVILAVVAYFFLIGRYGVRIGDLVTISGVTGNVIDIGLVRLYLMEFAGSQGQLHPTGRIVVFSNAVLFQPSALYKQMPGADFIWHGVTLTLQADSPLEVAREKLTAAVESVYEKYKGVIEKQHAQLEESVDLQMSAPRPDCRFRYSDTGLEFTTHYPAETARAAATDDLVMKALYDAIAADTRLKLAAAGAPKLA